MTESPRQAYLRIQDRRRRSIAWGSALVLYTLLGGGLFLDAIAHRETLSMNPGPIQIRIGSPDGVDEFSRDLPALKGGGEIAAPAPAASPPQAPLPAKAEKAADSTAALAMPPQAKAPPAKASQAGAPQALPPAAPTRLARDPGAPDGGPAGTANGSVLGSGSASLKGSEAGNSFETNLGGGGSIGRALSVPIYFYMPLPLILPFSFPDRFKTDLDGFVTKDARRLFFSRYYRQSGSSWQLSKPAVPLDERPGLWALLENAGYDPSQADYKRLRSLRPVTIDFELGPFNAETRRVPLLSVELRSSSGDKDVDEAVLYAFRQASYSNGGKDKVKARFTYSFE